MLTAASFVEVDDEIRSFGLEIGGRIVEREMGVFADAGEGDVYRRGGEELADAERSFVRGSVGIEQMVMPHAGFMNQAIEKVFAKTGGVGDRQADVLVEMKELDFLPVEFLRSNESVEKIQLGSSGCNDDARAAAIEDGVADGVRGLIGSGGTARALIFEHADDHFVHSPAAAACVTRSNFSGGGLRSQFAGARRWLAKAGGRL